MLPCGDRDESFQVHPRQHYWTIAGTNRRRSPTVWLAPRAVPQANMFRNMTRREGRRMLLWATTYVDDACHVLRAGCFPGTADSVTRCGIELSRDDIAATLPDPVGDECLACLELTAHDELDADLHPAEAWRYGKIPKGNCQLCGRRIEERCAADDPTCVERWRARCTGPGDHRRCYLFEDAYYCEFTDWWFEPVLSLAREGIEEGGLNGADAGAIVSVWNNEAILHRVSGTYRPLRETWHSVQGRYGLSPGLQAHGVIYFVYPNSRGPLG